jgi:hypothetical protein
MSPRKPTTQRVLVDFSTEQLTLIDRECDRLHVTRQSWIKQQLHAALVQATRDRHLLDLLDKDGK